MHRGLARLLTLAPDGARNECASRSGKLSVGLSAVVPPVLLRGPSESKGPRRAASCSKWWQLVGRRRAGDGFSGCSPVAHQDRRTWTADNVTARKRHELDKGTQADTTQQQVYIICNAWRGYGHVRGGDDRVCR